MEFSKTFPIKYMVVFSLLSAALLMTSCLPAQSQNWDEWFRQNKTQKKYLLQQIAALKIYAQFLNKGYQIVEDGLRVIDDIKKGHFSIDKQYFESLDNVNVLIGDNSYIDKSDDLIKRLEQLRVKCRSACMKSGLLPAEFITTVNTVFLHLQSDMKSDRQQITAITTSGNWQMNDSERKQQIETIFRQMENRYVFAGRYTTSVMTYLVQQIKETNEIKELHQLHDLKTIR